ncbi:MAG: ergothioneine biosynthesis protein EgtB [Gammaproteobacteria bacterium]|nr:ergothioneine biosynthesis protein EgtB [Gammaproteobacteria bacterium]
MDGSSPPAGSLIDRYVAARAETVRICAPLEIEDHVVQPISEVSPPKWHLGHTSWFFDHFVLAPRVPGHRPPDPLYDQLFNSYYKSAGPHWLQGERGHLSRPTVREISAWRCRVDEAMRSLLGHCTDPGVLGLIEAGIHHEQQHQELLLMDIKYILAANPMRPAYKGEALAPIEGSEAGWERIEPGLHEIGAEDADFAYDNERPRHRVWLDGCMVSRALVSNGEYLEFMRDGGYENPLLWQSKGWDWIQARNIRAPLYWFERDGIWHEYQLGGAFPLADGAPVMHVSWFEADAYARWRGHRLPREEEYEAYLQSIPPDREQALWCWTASPYRPYPGYRPFPPPLGEYNGKFMCDQFVLRGGCFATPRGHFRPSYRNFFEPRQRWMFSGIRLARD